MKKKTLNLDSRPSQAQAIKKEADRSLTTISGSNIPFCQEDNALVEHIDDDILKLSLFFGHDSSVDMFPPSIFSSENSSVRVCLCVRVSLL